MSFLTFGDIKPGDRFLFISEGYVPEKVPVKTGEGSFHYSLPGGEVSAAHPCADTAEVWPFDLHPYQHPETGRWNIARYIYYHTKGWNKEKTGRRTYRFKTWFDTQEEVERVLAEKIREDIRQVEEHKKKTASRELKREPSPWDPRVRGGRKQRVVRKGEFPGQHV